jgi:hypothetical protein
MCHAATRQRLWTTPTSTLLQGVATPCAAAVPISAMQEWWLVNCNRLLRLAAAHTACYAALCALLLALRVCSYCPDLVNTLLLTLLPPKKGLV